MRRPYQPRNPPASHLRQPLSKELIMLKEIVTMHSAEIGLVLFFVSFLVIFAWTITRSRKEVNDWSNLPLTQTNDPQAREME